MSRSTRNRDDEMVQLRNYKQNRLQWTYRIYMAMKKEMSEQIRCRKT